jgi:hypothetical protein
MDYWIDGETLRVWRSMAESGNLTDALYAAFTAGQECGYKKGETAATIAAADEAEYARERAKL